MRKILFCMTSDFTYDQRMQRVVNTLSNDFECVVFHRSATPFEPIHKNRVVHTIRPFVHKGPLFYLEYNLRLFFKLLFTSSDLIYAVDADTLTAAGMASVFGRRKLIYDSHELFAEVPELAGRNFVKSIWNAIEHLFIIKSSLNITVNPSLAGFLASKHSRPFHSILNTPPFSSNKGDLIRENIILYQGAVNKGRGLECAVEAMALLPDYKLLIIGHGDIFEALKNLIDRKPYKERITLAGRLLPAEILVYTRKAKFGLNLLSNHSLSYYFSLANKFFDYMQAGLPSVNMNFGEYERMIEKTGVGILIKSMDPKLLADEIREAEKESNYERMVSNCCKYSKVYNWEEQGAKLLELVKSL